MTIHVKLRNTGIFNAENYRSFWGKVREAPLFGKRGFPGSHSLPYFNTAPWAAEVTRAAYLAR
jgi:hypothetical protein